MKKTSFCVFVLLLVSSINAQQNDDDDASLEEWKDYDNYDYGMLKEEVDKILPKNEDDGETDLKVKEEIDHFRNQDALYDDFEDNYQIEDNRSDEEINGEVVEDKENLNEKDDKSPEKTDSEDDYNLLWGDSILKDIKMLDSTTKKDDESIIDEVIDKDPKAAIGNDYHLLWADDDLAPIPAPSSEEEDANILEDAKKLLEEDEDDKSDDAIPGAPADDIDTKLLRETLELLKEDEKDSLDVLSLSLKNFSSNILENANSIKKDIEEEPIPKDIQNDIVNIVKETEKLLKDSNSANEEDISEQKHENLEEQIEKLADEIDKAEEKLENEIDDTVDDAMDDLNDDLDRLFATLDKLKDGMEDTGDKAQEKIEEVFGSEEKDDFSAEFGDEDYESIDDSNLSEIFAKVNNPANKDDSNENAADEVLDDMIKEILEEEAKIDNSLENKNSNDDNEKPNVDEHIESKQIDNDSKPIMYQNDALLDGDSKQDESVVEQFNVDDLKMPMAALDHQNSQDIKEAANKESKEIKDSEDGEEKVDVGTPKTKMVEDLNSEELDDLMEQFKLVHKEELEIKSDVSPILIKLSVDEPVVVTSPNYPSFYPANTVTDWLFQGDGLGIELNITDFFVNGALQHYLLVKPGRADASGSDGLVFSYHLTSERRYRFMDVDRMFVRFVAGPGMSFRGFQFSVRMISPALVLEDDEVPEPEQLLPPPAETLTLNLGGLSVIDFYGVRAQFQQIIADMAKAYIQENDIDPGLNTTSEVTKIVATAVCNIRWPDYERCVELTFAVPLHYANESAASRLHEQDLLAMWRAFYDREPFAARLAMLGITEFSVPHDRSVVLAWLLLSLGVVLMVLLLAAAFWRFSCFDDYTRLRALRGASTASDKKSLDLFPAPHQPLPQLFESQYQWPDPPHAAPVDMGGYANKSFARDDMFGFDSDEDVIHSRDRSYATSPRAFYSEV